MADTVSKKKRSQIMAAVKSKDTTPEMVVRRVLRTLGFRYRLHCANITGSPDVAFPGKQKAIFVHGCFWHRHTCRNGRAMPKSNTAFWEKKFYRNKSRDRKVRHSLRQKGWDVLIIWECWTRDLGKLRNKLSDFMEK